MKNYVIEDDSMNDTKDTTTEETPTEETPKVYGLDDLKEDEKDQYLSNAFNYPNIFEIGKIKEENQKLAQEIMNNFSKMEDDESKKKILDDALSIVTQTKQESKIIPNIPRNLLTVCNYSCEFLTQASVKILSLTYIKYVWLDYPKTLNKIEAKIIVCRINSTTLSSQSFISKVYKATGLATASLDCFINCLKIMDNNNYSDEEKCKEILKNIGGETGAYVGVNKLAKSKMIKKLKKATKTIFKSFAKILKFGSKTNIITAVAGLALDCVVSYFTGDAIDTLCEEIIDKIFDAITD